GANVLHRDFSSKANYSSSNSFFWNDKFCRHPQILTLPKLTSFFVNAHITEGSFTFIDHRLSTTTQLKDFSADINIQSLKNPIDFFLRGSLVVNEKPAEIIELKGDILLGSSDKINLSRVKGNIGLKSGFCYGKGFFDASKLKPDGFSPLGKLFFYFDLHKLSQSLAGIIGFPPGYSWKGKLQLDLEAQGNLASKIAIGGITQLVDLSIIKNNFAESFFFPSRMEFSPEILFDFPSQKLELKTIRLSSDFFQLFLSGIIYKFSSFPYANLTISGSGSIPKTTQLLRNFFPFSPHLNLAGTFQLAFSGTGNLKNFHLKGATILKELKIDHPSLKGKPFQEKNVKFLPDVFGNLKKNNYTLSSLIIRANSLEGEIKGKISRKSHFDLQGNITINFP
ncbi:MAG: hypothetical protein N3A64_00185, partial [Desulfobacterota bacterium]|nr:hypothetical protein [Thermodesulfobacteriota bacterium]